MKKIFKKFAWYPPAESKLPASTFFSAFRSKAPNFEKNLSNHLGVKTCILANSARTLLYLLLDSLHKHDPNKRNEVLIPGYTCYSVAASIAKAGLKIRLYDIDPTTLHPNIDSLKRSLTSKTLAIISQHLFGIPTPLYEINDIAKENQTNHIEDAAQALGGSADGNPLGTSGDFGLYSFGRGKPLPVGSGGALISKNEKTLQSLKLKEYGYGFSQFAETAIAQLASKPLFYWILEMLPLGLGETHFDTDFDISGMPILTQNLADKAMPTLEGVNSHRRKIATIYKENLEGSSVFSVPENAIPVYTRFPIMAGQAPIPKDLKRLGVRRMYPQAIVDVDTIKPHLADPQAKTPGASEIARNLITLPTHKAITENLAKEIAHKVITAYNY